MKKKTTTKKKPTVRNVEVINVNCDGDIARFVENNADVAFEYWKAKNKHPKFVDRLSLPSYALPDLSKIALREARKSLKQKIKVNDVSFSDVFAEEYLEAMYAYGEGDLKHAKQELAQCAAVCIRAMDYIDDEIAKKKGKRK